MTSLQRQAVFHLIVTTACLVAVIALLVITKRPLASLAGFALIALTGFRSFRERGSRRPLYDERDDQINRRAGVISYQVFWVCFVAWGVALTMAFQKRAAVPIEYIAPAVWVAMWLVVTVRAVAILALDRASLAQAGGGAR